MLTMKVKCLIWGKRSFDELGRERCAAGKALVLVEERTHKGSFKSNSKGAGGLLGDCQNKPREEEKHPQYSSF